MLFKRRIKSLRSRDETVQKVIEHINYTDDTLEQRWAELLRRVEELEKAVKGE